MESTISAASSPALLPMQLAAANPRARLPHDKDFSRPILSKRWSNAGSVHTLPSTDSEAWRNAINTFANSLSLAANSSDLMGWSQFKGVTAEGHG
eukprot:2217217-Amphidinium_carterae.1